MTKPAAFPFRRALALTALAGVVALASPAFAQKQKAAKDQPAKQSAEDRYKQEKQYPTKVTWRLVELNNKPLPKDVDITLMIDDAFRGSGFAGCNSWSATIYPVRGQRFAVGPIAFTKKQCDAARMQLERAFLGGLHGGPEWDVQNSVMTLKGQAGAMKFERAL